jgi:DNA-binding CsgD family transcriptional regulator
MSMFGPFVGRERELDAIRALVGDVLRDGEPGALLVIGDPGTGKTRLLAETRSTVAIARTGTLVGYEPERPAPLAAASGLFRTLCDAGEAGAALSSLLFGRPAEPLEAIRVHEAAHRALASLGEILLLLDDVQWLDDASLALCRELLRSSEPRALVAAARPSGIATGFADALGAVLPRGRMQTVHLGPLEPDDALALLRALSPNLDAADAAALAEQAAGSPFWLEALARAGGERAAAVEERLRGLSVDASWVLAALAVAARPLILEELERLSGWHQTRLAYAIGETGRLGVTVEEAGAIRVSHNIIREVADRRLPELARRRLHRQLAEMIENEAGSDVALLRRAIEHQRSAGEPASRLALRLLEAPRRRLLGTEGVRDLGAIAEEAAGHEALALHAGIAELAFDIGDHTSAYERWMRVADEAPGKHERGWAALGASRAAYELGRGEEAHAALNRSRALAGDDPWLAVAQDGHEALVRLWLDRRPADAEPFAARALDAARSAGDPETPAGLQARRAAVQAAFDLASVATRWDEAGALADELLEASRGSEPWLLDASFSAAMHLRRSGRWLEAADALRRVWRRARDGIYPLVAMRAGYALAEALYRLGRLDEAEEVALDADELGDRIGGLARDTARFWAGWYGTSISRGKWADAVAALERLADGERDPHFRAGAHFEILTVLARLDPERRAGDVLYRIERAEADTAAAGCARCRAELLLRAAEACARIGQPERARRYVGQSDAEHPVADPVAAFARNHALSLATGDAEQLADAVAAADRLGLALEAIWARLDLAGTLVDSDRATAISVLEGAVERAGGLGAATERMAAERALRRLGVRTWRREAVTTGDPLERLTDREREIARFVAEGASNPEISRALFLSRKTVEHHVSNILTKLGLRNRAQLARLVAKNGGTPR